MYANIFLSHFAPLSGLQRDMLFKANNLLNNTYCHLIISFNPLPPNSYTCRFYSV